MEVYNSTSVYFKDCVFQHNGMTGLKVSITHIKIAGNLNFIGNRAYRGGAIIFIKESSITLSENSYISFENNSADDVLFMLISIKYLQDISTYKACKDKKCILVVEGERTEDRLSFTNNTAGRGGEVMYWGSLSHLCTEHNTTRVL